VGSRIPVGSDDGDGNAPGGAAHEAATDTATEPRPHLAEGRYLLQERLGGGGTADVFRGLDTRLNRAVAVKIFRPGAGSSAEHRFREEAQLLGPLEHPCLVTVYDAGVENGRAYVVLQLVDGVTLARRLVQGPLSPKQVVEVGARLADVLAYVHSRGIIHRDVKPSNVLVDEANVYLADFGISRLLGTKHNTATGLAVGTAAYMAPEQVRGVRVGPAADVYSLGLVLLECLTGRVEYPGGTVEAAIARLTRRPRISAGLPAPLRHVLCAMTESDPERRPSAARCANALTKARTLLGEEAAAKAAPAEPPAEPVAEPAVADQAGRAPDGVLGEPPSFARRFATRAGRRAAAAAGFTAPGAAASGGAASTRVGRHSAPGDEEKAPHGERPGRLARNRAERLRTALAGERRGTEQEPATDAPAPERPAAAATFPTGPPEAETSSARAARLAATALARTGEAASTPPPAVPEAGAAGPEFSAATPAETEPEAPSEAGVLPARSRRLARGRRRAASVCATPRLAAEIGNALRQRFGIRARIALGVLVAFVAVFAGSLITTPTRPTAAPARPPAQVPVPAESAEVPEPPVTLPTLPPSNEAPVLPKPPPTSTVEAPPPAPTPTQSPRYDATLPSPTPSQGYDEGEKDDAGNGQIGDGEYGDDLDTGTKPRRNRWNLFTWFFALLAHDD